MNTLKYKAESAAGRERGEAGLVLGGYGVMTNQVAVWEVGEGVVGGDWEVTLWRDQRVESWKVELASNKLGAQPFVTDPYMGRLRYTLHRCLFFKKNLCPKMLTLKKCEIKKSQERLSLRRTAEPQSGGNMKNNTAHKSWASFVDRTKRKRVSRKRS